MSSFGGPHGSFPPRPGAAGLSVVVIDDDPRWREQAARPFRERGDRVRTFTDGLQALAACVEDPPDVILTDVQMPRMDGWQLLRLIRSRPALAATPVVFLTSLDGDAERLRGYQLGVDVYVPKPFNPEELLIRVRRLVRKALPDPARPNGVDLKGDLEHVSAASLLSFLEIEKKTGVLLIVGDRVARLFVKNGVPLRAELEGQRSALPSRAVVHEVLGWTSGQFELSAEDVTVTDEIRTSISQLVLEHAKMTDERNR